jgi:integrase
VQAVLAALQGRTLFPIVSLALGSGARRGELMALKWSDLDLDRGTLRIERAVEQTKQGMAIKGTKTKYGRRLLMLPAITLDVLRAHWNETQRLYLVLGRGRVRAQERAAMAACAAERRRADRRAEGRRRGGRDPDDAEDDAMQMQLAAAGEAGFGHGRIRALQVSAVEVLQLDQAASR